MSSESEIEKAELQHLERVHPEANPAMDTEPTRRLTVLGTENQDPDVKQHISLRSWLILALCVLGQMQNIFILSVLPSDDLVGRLALTCWASSLQRCPRRQRLLHRWST
jgi:hypothetical protein